MDYVKAFLIGGLICALVQILMEKTKMMPGRIMVLLVCTGAVLGAVGAYEPFRKFAGAGASVPLLGFGNVLWKGVKEAVDADGALAGHDGAHDGAGAAGDEARGLHLGDQGLEVLVGDALDLNGQADRERNAPVAVLARDVGHHLHLLICENAVGRDYAGYKVLTVVGEDEAAALEGLLLGFGDFQQIHRLHIFINIDIVTQPRLPVKCKLPGRRS